MNLQDKLGQLTETQTRILVSTIAENFRKLMFEDLETKLLKDVTEVIQNTRLQEDDEISITHSVVLTSKEFESIIDELLTRRNI